jgi:hypothetical protein
MRKVRVPAFLVVLLLPLVAAANTAPAGAKTNALINRFAPSGNKAFYSNKSPARPKLPAGIKVSALSASSNGSSDASATNIRANQECTNQSAGFTAGTTNFYGRSTAQNETAAAVDPTNPNNICSARTTTCSATGNVGSTTAPTVGPPGGAGSCR